MSKTEQLTVCSEGLQRIGISLTGLIQGVGFRPHIYTLARGLGLTGWVSNSPEGVEIELEGNPDGIHSFLKLLKTKLPAHASIASQSISPLPIQGSSEFTIRQSKSEGERVPLILPDIAVCAECLDEMSDPNNRRYRYPFINCTHCGPRYSIVDALPYDRPNTSMAEFELCEDCRREYADPTDRRYHAQPIACPVCGPTVQFYQKNSNCHQRGEDALEAAINLLVRGEILALKGLGGFQLLVDASNSDAVAALRSGKRRGNKPFAILFPDLSSVWDAVHVSPVEAKLLQSFEAPIVLLKKKNSLFDAAAPRNPYLGVFLPYTPLHHLILRDLDRPLVATSGNLSNEPICIDDKEAFSRLGDLADGFLVHNRPIRRAVDDSVVQVVDGKCQVLRRARGYAPLPIPLERPVKPMLAVGGHLKNTIAIAKGKQVVLSQHIGDLDTCETFEAFQSTLSDFQQLYQMDGVSVVSDKHPDYLSTHVAQGFPSTDVHSIQHHLAHVYSCMADHQLTPPLTGIVWDGTGYGDEGALWGAEVFHLTNQDQRRVASLLPIILPGGEAAIHDISRIATSLLHAAGLPVPSDKNSQMLIQMITRGINAPGCSSMGRLFDGVSALIGLCCQVDFEGEAAMLLEYEAMECDCEEAYTMPVSKDTESPLAVFDWRSAVKQISDDLQWGVKTSTIARKFHNSLVDCVLNSAQLGGERNVLLTGGCFQNKLLSELAIRKLTQFGFEPYIHNMIPPNDGGLSAGQIYGAIFNDQTGSINPCA